MMKLLDIMAEAEKLTEEERASMAAQLLHGLRTPRHDVTDEEVMSRVCEAESHPEVMISFDQLISGLQSRAR